MSRSTLPRTARSRRGIAAAAVVVALPFTMAAGCQDEGAVEPGVEREEDSGEGGY